MNTAITALLVTLATPFQVAFALVLAPIALLVGNQRISKDYGVYPYVELDEAETYYEWASDFYGPSHPSTVAALAKVQKIQSKYSDLFSKDALDDAR